MSCPRLWEVEAVRDERLRGADRAAWERHAAQCAECTAEARALAKLSSILQTTEAPAQDDLAVRRARQRLLAKADEAATKRRPVLIRRGIFTGAALAAVALLAIFGPRWFARDAGAHMTAHIDIAPKPGASWSQRSEDHTDVIDLRAGALAISVHDRPENQHVIVKLPDGELEDIGTVFDVNVENERTTEVLVKEGKVELRLRDMSPVVLSAGDVWRARPIAPSLDVSSAPSSIAEMPGSEADPKKADAAPGDAPTAAGSASATAAPSSAPGSASASPSASASAAVAAVDPATIQFRRAMAALRAGAYAEAAEAFRAFRANYPQDPRAEDAAYLRVVALSRGGQKDAARTAAEDYKTNFPQGFRGREVAPLTTGSATAKP